ncbi:hypothetical protein [Shimia sp.]|uniref:hypothetical protein n=1 Tax=Shimia sp. TaxID=1954381 RepID=UPI003298D634
MKHIESEADLASKGVEPPHKDVQSPNLVRNIYLALAGGLGLWGGAIALWGVPGLYMPAVLLVPVFAVLLVIVTRG